MGTAEFREAVGAMSADEKAKAAIELTNALPREKQKEVAQGIDKNAWPQESRHRMITILGALLIAALFLAVGVWASTFAGASTIVTAAPLVTTAIVGGIFGYSVPSRA